MFWFVFSFTIDCAKVIVLYLFVFVVSSAMHQPIFILIFVSNILYFYSKCLTDQGLREDLGIHHIVVNDWDRGFDADQNFVLISVPSVLSPDLAPPGKHVLHAYTPGTEPFELWKGLDPRSAEYKKLKAERSEVLI